MRSIYGWLLPCILVGVIRATEQTDTCLEEQRLTEQCARREIILANVNECQTCVASAVELMAAKTCLDISTEICTSLKECTACGSCLDEVTEWAECAIFTRTGCQRRVSCQCVWARDALESCDETNFESCQSCLRGNLPSDSNACSNEVREACDSPQNQCAGVCGSCPEQAIRWIEECSFNESCRPFRCESDPTMALFCERERNILDLCGFEVLSNTRSQNCLACLADACPLRLSSCSAICGICADDANIYLDCLAQEGACNSISGESAVPTLSPRPAPAGSQRSNPSPPSSSLERAFTTPVIIGSAVAGGIVLLLLIAAIAIPIRKRRRRPDLFATTMPATKKKPLPVARKNRTQEQESSSSSSGSSLDDEDESKYAARTIGGGDVDTGYPNSAESVSSISDFAEFSGLHSKISHFSESSPSRQSQRRTKEAWVFKDDFSSSTETTTIAPRDSRTIDV